MVLLPIFLTLGDGNGEFGERTRTVEIFLAFVAYEFVLNLS